MENTNKQHRPGKNNWAKQNTGRVKKKGETKEEERQNQNKGRGEEILSEEEWRKTSRGNKRAKENAGRVKKKGETKAEEKYE